MSAVTATRTAERLLDALAALDFDAAAELFGEEGRLRALVPTALREETGAGAIADRFRLWWDDLADLQLIERETGRFHDRIFLRYRWRGRDPEDGWVEVEQQGWLTLAPDGTIAALNVVCSGFVPVS